MQYLAAGPPLPPSRSRNNLPAPCSRASRGDPVERAHPAPSGIRQWGWQSWPRRAWGRGQGPRRRECTDELRPQCPSVTPTPPNLHTPIPRNKRQHWRPACPRLIAWCPAVVVRRLGTRGAPLPRRRRLPRVATQLYLHWHRAARASAEEVGRLLHLLEVEIPCGAEAGRGAGPLRRPAPSA